MEDLPEPRRENLLWRHLRCCDYTEVEELVCEQSRYRCPVDAELTPEAVTPRVAVLGDDGRYHLRTGPRMLCDPGGPAAGPLEHRQWCHWWGDGIRYRLQPPRGSAAAPGHDGVRAHGWTVTLTDRVRDPIEVPLRERCPHQVRCGQWPPPPSTTKAGRLRARLTSEFGPMCGACGSRLGTEVDHDHFAGAVRGLLCHRCNSGIDTCPHPTGCRWAEYLNHPPAAPLCLRYSHHRGLLRVEDRKVAAAGFDPFFALRRRPFDWSRAIAPSEAVPDLTAILRRGRFRPLAGHLTGRLRRQP
ncbi:hypothetical protein BIV57_13345 [Mangrovactinospora gilvigrisea]|uniref:Recombination endonuclease VII n=1 Tax=Mangrovactinospora gilvigrisea TaxID=1428644 RepID=A0A1J7BEH4_9ACTN|nr:hypothetical protein BIV57_13345 [Mangrovactinospora gilvigrisea]